MYVIFFVAVFLHIASIYFSFSDDFTRTVDAYVIFYSTLDLFLSIAVIFFITKAFPDFFKNGREFCKSTYLGFFERNSIVLLLLVFIAGLLAYQSMELILSGIARHDLLREYDRGGLLYMFVSGFFKIFFPFVLFFESSKKLKLLAGLGLVFSIMITASRSELLYVINFYLVLMLFSRDSSHIVRLFTVVVLMIVTAIFSTIFLQGRPMTEGFYAIIDMTRTVFQYRSYSYFLSDISIAASYYDDKLLFPFFGYVSEFIIRLFSPSQIPIDSKFVADLHVLGASNETGRPFLANIIYPWWSWFVGSFGAFGLVLKAIYSYILLHITIAGKFMFTFVILLSFIIFGTTAAHPLLTLTHTFAVFTGVMIDLTVLFFAKYRLRIN